MSLKAFIAGANTDPQEYQAQDYGRGHPKFTMSYSSLKEFARCPSRWRAGYQADDSDSTDYGNLLDTLLLTPDKFEKRFAIAPKEYPATPKRKGEPEEMKPWTKQATYCKQWEANQVGKTVIKADDHADAKTAIARLEMDLAIADYVQCSAKQVSVNGTWTDSNGMIIPLRMLIDLVPDMKHERYGKTIGDFKTARSASVRSWQKQVFDFWYHVQAALYLDAYIAATGEDRCDFRHIVQESIPPYQTAKRVVSQEYLELGRATYKATLSKYAECIATDSWPDYDTTENGIEGWTLTQPEAWMVTP